MGNESLPPIHQPDGARPTHDDYIPGLRWIPRGWTSFKSPLPPRQVAGNQKYWGLPHSGGSWTDVQFPDGLYGPKPIPRPGEWQVSLVTLPDSFPRWIKLPYFSYTSRGGHHVRLGARWTDTDDYITFPSIAYKKYPPKSRP